MSTIDVERQGDRIYVRFPYSESDVGAIRAIPGRRWLSDTKTWSLPLDMSVCRLLRRQYGQRLMVGPELRSWAVEARRAEERLGRMAAADSGDLRLLPDLLPTLHEAIYYGPLGKREGVAEGSYQTADVRFLADSTAPLNANHQGLGKTLEAIAEVWESGRHVGDHLVICPKGAIDTVWLPELQRWQADAPVDVMIFPCTGSKRERKNVLNLFSVSEAPVNWVIVNPEMVRYEKDETNTSDIAIRAKPKEAHAACGCNRLVDPHWHYRTRYQELGDHVWRTIINDEVHTGNIRNQRSLTAKSVYALKVNGKRVAMSGTPMKKKGADIWGILHYLRPDVFTSFWNFAEMFFDITEDDYGKTIGGLRNDRKEEFYQYLMPYVLRRTKAECAPWLPFKQHIDVWVTLEDKQYRQYSEMLEEGVAQLEGGDVSTTSILAQFTRLQQFANAYCELQSNDKVAPTPTSAKLDALWERLAEAGILDGSSEDQTVIFSQSRLMVELISGMLFKDGVNNDIISGKNIKKRADVVKRFQTGETKVLCIVTTAGGVALTLDAADTAHFIDEPWAPDTQEQAEDRLHRVSRIHQVTIYHYRARETIDETKHEVAQEKHDAHELILDVRRKILGQVKG
jgi:SNF2 family DNA or RNA helicase